MRPKGNNLPVDPDVHVPAAVRAAAAAADAHYQQNPDPVPPANPQPDPVSPAEPPATPPATPPVEPPPVTPPGNEPQPEPSLNDLPADELARRLKAANGRVKSLIHQNDQNTQRISGLETIIEDMRQQITQLSNAPKPPAAPPPSFVTQEDRDNYGDMIDVVGRAARDAVNPEVAELRSQVAELSNILNSTAGHIQRTDRQKMFDALDQQLPNWREVNVDEKFLAWLALPDPYSGAIRSELLKRAYEQNRSPQVLAFFKGFLAQEAAVDPQPGTPTPPAPQPQRPSLEQFAAPGRAKSPAGGSPPPVEKPIITTSQIDAFYAMVRRGEFAGRDEEKDRLERMIFEAQHEGRVRRS